MQRDPTRQPHSKRRSRALRSARRFVLVATLAALSACHSMPQRYSLTAETDGQVYVLDHNLTLSDCASEARSTIAAHNVPGDIYCRTE